MYDASKDPNYRDDIVIGKIDFSKIDGSVHE